MSNEKDDALQKIRRLQADRIRSLGKNHSSSDSQVQAALAQAKKRETASRLEGDLIYSGHFKYPAKLEQLRWQRTREIIERVMPGPHEDAEFLEMLARQAASVEMILRNEHMLSPDEHPNKRMIELLQGVLLAIIPDPLVDTTRTQRVSTSYVLVSLSAGLIEFIYQAGKAVVLSEKQETPETGWASKVSTELKDTEDMLVENSYPIDLLLGTLENYFFKGWPRYQESKLPPIKYHPQLSILTSMSERFVIAHEYSHALLHFSKEFESLKNSMAWDKEFLADTLAYHITLGSAWQFDLVANNIALGGALFALQAIEVLLKAKDVIEFGGVREDYGFKNHPAPKLRIEYLKDIYQRESSRDEDYDPRTIKGALVPIETLDLLWEYVYPRLVALRGTAKLHPIWGSTEETNKPQTTIQKFIRRLRRLH